MHTRSLSAEGLAAAPARYELAVPGDARRRLALGWLALAIAALVGSGLFSVLLVLSRAPYVKDLLPVADFFRVALVVHVDLSVLVWFSAFAGLLWSLHGTPAPARARAGRGSPRRAAATLVMCAAPFVDAAPPVMSNYVPVLDGPVFLGGLLLFAAGCARSWCARWRRRRASARAPTARRRCASGSTPRRSRPRWRSSPSPGPGSQLPASLDGKAYFEVLFWGGGHVLQFTWTLLMFAAWLWLAEASGAPRAALAAHRDPALRHRPRVGVRHAGDLPRLRRRLGRALPLQTWLMRIGGGLAIVPFALQSPARSFMAPACFGRATAAARGAALVAGRCSARAG